MRLRPDFDPARVARLETEAWRAYYDRRWLRMARVLVAGHREQFGLSLGEAIVVTLYSSRAAMAAAPLDHSDTDKARRLLVPYYRRVRRALGSAATPEALAEREIDYWIVHRRLALQRKANPAASAPDSLEDMEPMVVSFAQLHAALFDSTPEAMRPSAEQRALAAKAVDRITGGYSIDVPGDWQRVETYLIWTYETIAAVVGLTGAPAPPREVAA